MTKLLSRVKVRRSSCPSLPNVSRPLPCTDRMLIFLICPHQITEDVEVQKRIMRMHGFNLMNSMLKEFPDDKPIVKLVRRRPFLPASASGFTLTILPAFSYRDRSSRS
jgi:hypothetical protein